MYMKVMSDAILKNTNYSNSGKRALIYSESTFPGSGAYGGTWIGDLPRQWISLRAVISQVMNLNMFGIQNVQTDVCGDSGERDNELCARWMQMAAFLPMARNYYNMYYWNYEKGVLCGTETGEFFYMD
jgi:alpha-glucosidase (family GH31 glycosyl hydrolase)